LSVTLRYGFILNAGRTADSIVAVAAEEHGWDGLFIADAIGIETKDFPLLRFSTLGPDEFYGGEDPPARPL
jgi:hypothetical protein